jgi:hypothetical protein
MFLKIYQFGDISSQCNFSLVTVYSRVSMDASTSLSQTFSILIGGVTMPEVQKRFQEHIGPKVAVVTTSTSSKAFLMLLLSISAFISSTVKTCISPRLIFSLFSAIVLCLSSTNLQTSKEVNSILKYFLKNIPKRICGLMRNFRICCRP